MGTFYYVWLIGASVGGTRVPGVTERDLQLDPYTGHRGVILDSGTTMTRLALPVYIAIHDTFRPRQPILARSPLVAPSASSIRAIAASADA